MRQASYKNYLLVLLMLILAFNSVDRVALGIVFQDIKADLHLTDTQLGFLTGIAFALFYSVMGIPIARWADRGNRVKIISITTMLWSAAVVLSGMATTFVQMLLVRIGVAVGEAGCVPPAHSLIADHFTRAERPKAAAQYMLGLPLALTVGYLVAGWLNQFWGWRATFVLLGLPGIALAALAHFTLREPRCLPSGNLSAQSTAVAGPSFSEACIALWTNITFRHLLICFSVWNLFGYGLLQWQPAFFMRSHGLQTGELGTWFALIYGVGGGLGVYLGGEWAGRYAAEKERQQLRACAVAFAFFAVLNVYAYLVSNHYLALGALAIAALTNVVQGPILAVIQTLVEPRMRAMSIALVYLFSNLIGMGLGPMAAGVLSDALRPWLGEESLRYALVMLCPGYLWAAWHLLRAGRTVEQDLRVATRAEYANSAHDASTTPFAVRRGGMVANEAKQTYVAAPHGETD